MKKAINPKAYLRNPSEDSRIFQQPIQHTPLDLDTINKQQSKTTI